MAGPTKLLLLHREVAHLMGCLCQPKDMQRLERALQGATQSENSKSAMVELADAFVKLGKTPRAIIQMLQHTKVVGESAVEESHRVTEYPSLMTASAPLTTPTIDISWLNVVLHRWFDEFATNTELLEILRWKVNRIVQSKLLDVKAIDSIEVTNPVLGIHPPEVSNLCVHPTLHPSELVEPLPQLGALLTQELEEKMAMHMVLPVWTRVSLPWDISVPLESVFSAISRRSTKSEGSPNLAAAAGGFMGEVMGGAVGGRFGGHVARGVGEAVGGHLA
ncbi:hypothetical protein B5M09_013620, partial [Aphanomyces astaci]